MTDDAVVTKRKVTMESATVTTGGKVDLVTVVDYVPEEILDAYVADARTRWQSVSVSDKPDAGPGGYDGDTTIPAHLVD